MLCLFVCYCCCFVVACLFVFADSGILYLSPYSFHYISCVEWVSFGAFYHNLMRNNGISGNKGKKQQKCCLVWP